ACDADIRTHRLSLRVRLKWPVEPTGSLKTVSKFRQGRPARVGLRLAVVVGLATQVLAANRAEAGAVVPAEDLVGQLERERVARPGGEVELVVLEVRRGQLFVVGRVG